MNRVRIGLLLAAASVAAMPAIAAAQDARGGDRQWDGRRGDRGYQASQPVPQGAQSSAPTPLRAADAAASAAASTGAGRRQLAG